MLGIIGAMEEEVNEILALMNVEKEYQECNYHFYEGLLGKKEVVVVKVYTLFRLVVVSYSFIKEL